MMFIKEGEENIMYSDSEIRRRWFEYFDTLLNTKKRRKDLEETEKVERLMRPKTEEEVVSQLEKMKSRKANGLDEFPIEVAKSLGQTGIFWLTIVLQNIQKNGIPSDWRKSKLTPLYKQKGDHLNFSKYRGIKILIHCLKLWERVIEPRLREMVNISQRKFGFQKGKSTVQPMFCLEMLQEKMRE